MTRPPASYRWLSRFLAPVLGGHALLRARRDGGWRYLRARYGFVEAMEQPPVWLHCASVGEVATAMPLVHALAERGCHPLVLSTNTPTGHERARAQVPSGVRVVYLPIDRPGPVRRFVDRIRPRIALVLETELWPHLFAALAKRAVPIIIVNGRLSQRSLQAPRLWRHAASWCLARTHAILVRCEQDRRRFGELDAPPERVRVLGNLKNAAPVGPPPEPIELGRPFVLAASTHHDEEQQLARALGTHQDPSTLWVIAPRHPERGPAIRRELAGEGWTVAQRSLGEAVPSGFAIYLADTLGELPGLMRAARVVVMGGSLIPHGGQNVLEPARAARAMVTGPHMDNFADETAGLRVAGGLLQVDDAYELVASVASLLEDTPKRVAMGEAAHQWLARQPDPASLYRQAIEPYLGQSQRPDAAAASARSDEGD